MVAPRRSKAPLPDFASHPSEEEFITSFLRPRVLSGDKSCKFIHEADVYAADPAYLTGGFEPALASNGDKAWYFFSTVRAKGSDGQRKARTVDSGEGCWHSEAGSKPVVVGGRRCLGHRKSFSFVTKERGRRVRSGWLMVELGLDDGQEELALCKVYFSPRANKKPAVAASGRKRKAADATAPVRQRRRVRLTSEADDPVVEEIVGIGKDPMADEADAPQEDEDESSFSWWLRNKSRLMAELGIDEAGFEHIRVEVPDVPPPPPSSGPREKDYLRWLPMEDILELPECKAWFQQYYTLQPPPPPPSSGVP